MKTPRIIPALRILTVVAVGLLTVTGATILNAQQTPVGGIARDFTLRNRATQQSLSLYEYAGHVVVLDFFTYWCGPCQTSSPDVEVNIQQYYNNRGGNPSGIPVTVIGVNIEMANPALTDQFVANAGMHLVGDDINRQAWGQFGKGYIPHFVIINGVAGLTTHQQWQVLYTDYGYRGATFLRAHIDSVQTTTQPSPPMITAQPVSRAVSVTQSAHFSIVATGNPAVSYQWQRLPTGTGEWISLTDGPDYSGSTTSLLQVISPTLAMDGDRFRCVATNTQGSATSNSASLIIRKVQTIAFAQIPDRTFGDPPFTVAATASSGLPVSFALVNGPATVTSAGAVTLTGAGTVTIRATQSGNANYEAASPVDRTFTVAKATGAISLSGLVWLYDGAPKSVAVSTSPSGLSFRVTYNGATVPPSIPGVYNVVATLSDANYQGTATAQLVIAEVRAATCAPCFTATESVDLTSTVLGSDVTAYQWQVRRANGGTAGGPTTAGSTNGDDWIDIEGATAATLNLACIQPFHAAEYRVVVTIAGVPLASASTLVQVAAAPVSDSRLLNLSTRGLCLAGDDVLIPGFVISGTGTKRLLVRAVGPTLAAFGVPGTLPDPQLFLKRQISAAPAVWEEVATNNDWRLEANAAEIAAAALRLGAFDLTLDGADAAVLVDLPPGVYSVINCDTAARTGVALVELYDADPPDAGISTAHLANISNRGYVGIGSEVMIPGFVVSDEGPKTFLVRAVGPTLSQWSLTGLLEDPKVTIHRSIPGTSQQEVILWCDNWGENGDAADIHQTAAQVGAFDLYPGSKDAAFVITLPPGVYSAVASGTDGRTGTALVEIYVVR